MSQNVQNKTQNSGNVLKKGYVRSLTKLIAYIIIYAAVMASFQWLEINIVPELKSYKMNETLASSRGGCFVE